MKIDKSFAKKPEAPEAKPSEIGLTPVATASRQLPSKYRAMPGDVMPEFSDINFPRLNIVQKVGELSNLHPHGAVLFNGRQIIFELPVKKGDEVVAPGTPPVRLLVLGMKPKRFMEKIPYGSDERALIVDSEEKVVAAGGTLSYEEWDLLRDEGMRLFIPTVDVFVGIQKPEHVGDPHNTQFPYKVGDTRWAMAMWMLKSTSYTNAAKPIYTARANGCLRAGLFTYTWDLSTALKQKGKNFYYVPVLKEAAPATEAEVAFARKALLLDEEA